MPLVFLKYRLQWTGHIARMDDSRIPEKVFEGCCGVRRSVGRPRGRWEDVFSGGMRQICYRYGSGWRQEGTEKVDGQISGRARPKNGSKRHKRRKKDKNGNDLYIFYRQKLVIERQ